MVRRKKATRRGRHSSSRKKTRGRRASRKKSSRNWNPVRHPGTLKAVGYNLEEGASKRREALIKAIKKYGYTETVRKVSFLAGAAAIPASKKKKAKADLNWLKKLA